VSDVDIIGRGRRIGFAQVKNNKGALTPGSTSDTADNFTNRKLYELSHNLKSGSFRWNPIRRIYVEKPGKSEKRPLGVPDFQNKVIQTAMRIVLETIYEPIFEYEAPLRIALTVLGLVKPGL
jgi:retron-type reverse transcriptase